ncbi:carbohydrate ABC transporter permease [Bacillus sp. DX1.1]|uniref:carbohydrate ABC transporter permease n=1 Tax=unclassified Bacillus (in: firmicutes) TaxID=185979 RepID=UPI0025709C55|nr:MULTISPECIES: carbohydrate ABC transporter permease [unclassified Bacillus (in: firmicutes)]MDM5153111.1 carbohydrate ABC transporter permease [Bacillus sp. DX1.1]WJE82084.1 carbohydrate ABC transporter permease [Bacillus sp. DX3.1]
MSSAEANNTEKINEILRLSKKNKNYKSIVFTVIKHFLLIMVAISMIAPFFWMISTSLKTGNNVFSVPPQWIPNPVNWGNYAEVFVKVPFLQYILNTTFYTVSVTFLEVSVSLIVAYGFARFQFKGKNLLFMFLLITIMLPGEITIVPGYIYWAKIGEVLGIPTINTYIPLILPALGGQAVHVFFMSQYFRTIPKDFSEAAYINGASSWKILWRVYVPMSIPAIITIAISSFMGTWNSFLGPLIYLNDIDKFTVQVGLAMFQGMFEVNWPLLMAATTLSIIPILVLFFSAQKYFVGSNKADGVK